MAKDKLDLRALTKDIFGRVQHAVSENYQRDPADKKKSGGFVLKSITEDPRPGDKQLVFKANNGIPYGLSCKCPNQIVAFLGAKARVRINADSANILTFGTDFSNSKEYTLWGTNDESIDRLSKKIARNLDTQHRIRVVLGI